MPQPQQFRIQAMSVTDTTAHSNVGSWTHWARPGIEPASLWILVRLVTAQPQQELPRRVFYNTVLTISCNLLNTVLKVRIDHCKRSCLITWWHRGCPASGERILWDISLVPERINIPNSKCCFYWMYIAFTPLELSGIPDYIFQISIQ